MGNEISIFNFEGRDVRTVEVNGKVHFVASDVCAVLEIKDVSDALSRLDADEKGKVSIPTPGGLQEVLVINEFGLYTLVLGSRKAQAKPFKRWVTHEVLPEIREKGSYSVAKLSPGLQMIVNMAYEQARIEQEQQRQKLELEKQKARLNLIEQKTNTDSPYWAIMAYANNHGIPLDHEEAKKLGFRASKLSDKMGYKKGKTNHSLFGTVNTYYEEVLDIVFEEYFNGEEQ